MLNKINLLKKFVPATNINTLKYFIKNDLQYLPIIDYVGENNNSFEQNYKMVSEFNNEIIAIKLSGLKSKLDLYTIVDKAIENNNKILIDAENYKLQNEINYETQKLVEIYNTDDIHIYKTFQMYYKDSFEYLKNYMNLYPNTGVKLVRGAYYNEDKSTNKLNINKYYTDLNYDNAIAFLLDGQKGQSIIATHNNLSASLALELSPTKDFFKFAQLLGMNDNLSKELKEKKAQVYKYVPYGPYNESIPYLVRRLYENLDSIKYTF